VNKNINQKTERPVDKIKIFVQQQLFLEYSLVKDVASGRFRYEVTYRMPI
jgi:hypothetical protein